MAAEEQVALKTWIAVGGSMLGAFMAVLNIQITNASLPYIEGGIGTGGVNGQEGDVPGRVKIGGRRCPP
jgi:MFS transporter, DHA2 family, multidrug resistance protein